jgi:uncharacterized protein YcbK (DUF882 family)
LNDIDTCKVRRRILKASLAFTLTGLNVRPAQANLEQQFPILRDLSFYNLHTGESFNTDYWADGNYLPDAMTGINHILRDFRTNEVLAIDSKLIDLLYSLRSALGSKQPFQVISGYRSPTTNASLSANSDGVAKGSLHMQGKAIDLRIEGTALENLREAAMSLQGGGVGYYAKSNFVHVDVGRVRHW